MMYIIKLNYLSIYHRFDHKLWLDYTIFPVNLHHRSNPHLTAHLSLNSTKIKLSIQAKFVNLISIRALHSPCNICQIHLFIILAIYILRSYFYIEGLIAHLARILIASLIRITAFLLINITLEACTCSWKNLISQFKPWNIDLIVLASQFNILWYWLWNSI